MTAWRDTLRTFETYAKRTDEELFVEDAQLTKEWDEENGAHHSAANIISTLLEWRGISPPPVWEVGWRVQDRIQKALESHPEAKSVRHALNLDEGARDDIQALLEDLVAMAERRGERRATGKVIR